MSDELSLWWESLGCSLFVLLRWDSCLCAPIYFDFFFLVSSRFLRAFGLDEKPHGKHAFIVDCAHVSTKILSLVPRWK